MTNSFHIPVLLKEVIEGLNVKPGKKYIDATLGGGGHTLEILKKGGEVLGIDCDSEAIEYSRKRLEAACPLGVYPPAGRWKLIKGNFADILKIAKKENFYPVSGILFDLGVSSHQLETSSRGFSFNREGLLDMRMDKDLIVSAADLVNALSKNELYFIFKKFGEEFHSREIADAIIRARRVSPIKTTDELARIVLKVAGKRTKRDRTHPATRIFQALRICVNDELNNLKRALPQVLELLEKGGRLAVISFHSLEDRIVKNFLKENEELRRLKILTKKPIRPGEEEIKKNVRSRSAKLRIAVKE